MRLKFHLKKKPRNDTLSPQSLEFSAFHSVAVCFAVVQSNFF